MKKVLNIVTILIIMGIYTLMLPTNKVHAVYTEDEYRKRLNESVAYAMSLVDDNMTDHEKAFVFAQYCQEGNIYRNGISYTDSSSEEVFADHEASSTGYAEAFQLLCVTEGIPCDVLFSYSTNYAFNICYLDGEWTYVDIARDTSSKYKPQSFSGNLFVGKDKINSEKFEEAFYKNGELNNYYYPEGVDRSLEFDFSENFSRIYYDENYKYYEEKEVDGNQSYIYRENRKTGEKNILAETFIYDNTISGIVKDEDKIYYVGNNGNSIYSMGIEGESEVEEFKNTEEGKVICGIFVRDGYIYYVLRDTNSAESEEVKYVEWKKLSTAISTGTYTVDNENYQYKLNYIQTSKGIVISSWERIGDNEISELYIPNTINGLPVIGIGEGVFNQDYSNSGTYGVDYIKGEITLPENLEYISERAFYSCGGISKINFNAKLKSIGTEAFAYCKNLIGTLEMTDNISYVGKQAFYGCDYEKIVFSDNLKIISDSALGNNKNLDDVIVIPEGVVSVGYFAFSSTPVYAAILPSSLINLGDYAFGDNKESVEIAIKSEKMEAFRRNYKDNYKYYLISGTQTSNYAEARNIDYEDLRNAKPDSIKFKESNIELYTNSDIYQLEYTVTPRFFEGYEAIWYSLNENIVTVNENGGVTPKEIGTAVVEVEIDGVKSNCTINVKKPITQTISGTIKNLKDITKEIKIELIDKKTNTIIQTITLKGDSTRYSFDEVIKGDYILKVAQDSIIREYEISVGDEPVEKDIEIYLRGDINNDGEISTADLSYGLKRVTGTKITEDETKRGDITDDGEYTTADLSKLLRYLTNVIDEL